MGGGIWRALPRDRDLLVLTRSAQLLHRIRKSDPLYLLAPVALYLLHFAPAHLLGHGLAMTVSIYLLTFKPLKVKM